MLSRATVAREGRVVLRGVNWSVGTGQRWIVCGDNGAGKTQLLRLIAGEIWAEPGGVEYRVEGEALAVPLEARRHVAYVGPERQDRYARLDWDYPAASIVATGLHRTDIPLDVPAPHERRRVAQVLRALGIGALARRRYLSLSYGERRLVLLARALVARPSLLLLDEILAGLDARNRARVLGWLESAGARESGWVISTHRIEEVPRLRARWLLLERGEARVVRPSEVRIARSRAARRPALRRRSHAAGARARKALVELESASVYLDYRLVLRPLTLTVRPGECWVVHGANGSGKTTLLRAIYGDHPFASGSRVQRRGVEPGVPLERFRERCALLAPHLLADYPRDTHVLDCIVSGLRSSFGLDAPADRAEQARARRALARVGLPARIARRPLATLSHGQARRVLLARALVRRPQLLLLDEPYAGLDGAARRALQATIDRFLRRSGAVLLASHHRDEWPRRTTHEVELERGAPVYCGAVRR